LEIEKLSWFWFKRELPTKVDKKAFDEIFKNADLYNVYLSNAVNPNHMGIHYDGLPLSQS
jgi:hypothetical protein